LNQSLSQLLAPRFVNGRSRRNVTVRRAALQTGR
jgi:hypothetical protein